MSEKYKIVEEEQPYSVTCKVIGCVDIFSQELYKEKVVEGLNFYQANKGLRLHAWVIMSNHLHLIISSRQKRVPDIIRDFKRDTSRQIIIEIENNNEEIRREWMLDLFHDPAKGDNANKEYQFWKNDCLPIVLDTQKKVIQQLIYLHENPVRSGIVWDPQSYKYSSAIDYYTKMDGLLRIERL